MDFILPSLVRFDHVRGQFKIQETVGISKKLQSYLKNHFGDAWKQKTMAYFISNRINPIFDVEGEINFEVLVAARDEQKGDFYLRVVNKVMILGTKYRLPELTNRLRRFLAR